MTSDPSPRKRVRIVGTGGTIARIPASGVLPAAGLVEDIGRLHPGLDLRSHADLEFADVLAVGSERFTPPDWVLVAGEIRDAVADDHVSGVVLTHGTFTVEETAYFLHLTIGSRKPLVIACSQRPHTSIGNDGDRNLLDAIRVAADDDAVGMGTLLVVNESIHSARGVRKTSGRPDGFVSGTTGVLGYVDSERVTFYTSPLRRHSHLSEFTIPASLPRVEVVATYAGADGTAVRAFIDQGVDGVVVNGFSFNGMPHHMQEEALREAAAAGIAVVVVNRGGDGRIAPDAYNEGFVRGDNLSAQQARVLLLVALANGCPVDDLQRVFDQY